MAVHENEAHRHDLSNLGKVRQILSVGNIGLGDHDGIGLCTLDDQAKQPDELMSLGQIDTG